MEANNGTITLFADSLKQLLTKEYFRADVDGMIMTKLVDRLTYVSLVIQTNFLNH